MGLGGIGGRRRTMRRISGEWESEAELRLGRANTLHKLDRNNFYFGFFNNAWFAYSCVYAVSSVCDVGVSDRPIGPCPA